MDLAAMTKESVLKCASKFFLSLRNGRCACFAIAAMTPMHQCLCLSFDDPCLRIQGRNVTCSSAIATILRKTIAKSVSLKFVLATVSAS